jgi:hypothetical protein
MKTTVGITGVLISLVRASRAALVPLISYVTPDSKIVMVNAPNPDPIPRLRSHASALFVCNFSAAASDLAAEPEEGQENILRRTEITPGKNIEHIRETIVPHDDGEGADMVEKRESLLPSDNALPEEEEKDRR